MLNTTFAKAHKAGACTESYKKMATSLGGIAKYGKDTPIPLSKIVEACGLKDTIWALRCTQENSENILIEFACQCAEHVLHFYEDKCPDDKRPRSAIISARACLNDKTDAVEDAAWYAAWYTAWYAAWAASWAAEAAGAAGAARAAGDAARAAWAAGAARAARAAEAAEAAETAGAAAGTVEDAAWYAAWYAAWAAARAAEETWQTKALLKLLEAK